MQHDLDWVVLSVVLEALAPVIANGIGEDASRLVERRRSDATTHVGIALETVLGILVPEVERAIRSSGAKGSVDRVEGNVVDGMHVNHIALNRVAMAFKRKVGSIRVLG